MNSGQAVHFGLQSSPMYAEYLRRGAIQPAVIHLDENNEADYRPTNVGNEIKNFEQENLSPQEIQERERERIRAAKLEQKRQWIAQGLVELEE
jgi:hypothetical protein